MLEMNLSLRQVLHMTTHVSCPAQDSPQAQFEQRGDILQSEIEAWVNDECYFASDTASTPCIPDVVDATLEDEAARGFMEGDERSFSGEYYGHRWYAEVRKWSIAAKGKVHITLDVESGV